MAKQGFFNFKDLTVNFGGILSKPHNIFTAKAIKVPTYSYKKKEKECLGNGWYSSNTYTETIITVDNLYIIIKNGVCIGQMIYKSNSNIKSELNLCNEQALKFVNKIGIEYKPLK